MKLLIISFLMLTLAGCGTLKTVAEGQNKLAVQYATLKVLEQDNVTNERILALTAKAKLYIKSDVSVTVSTLVDAARTKLVSSDISIADQLLIGVILNNAQQQIEARLGSEALADEQKLQLLTVINWIELAAEI